MGQEELLFHLYYLEFSRTYSCITWMSLKKYGKRNKKLTEWHRLCSSLFLHPSSFPFLPVQKNFLLSNVYFYSKIHWFLKLKPIISSFFLFSCAPTSLHPSLLHTELFLLIWQVLCVSLYRPSELENSLLEAIYIINMHVL